MSKHAEVTATYRTNENECFQITVSAPASFPDVIDELRTQAVRGVGDLLGDALDKRYATDEPATQEP